MDCSKFKNGGWCGFDCSYDDLFDHKVIYSETFGCYQGDYFFLLKDGDKVGLSIVGYGSCSGCDALEGCDSTQELQALADSQNASVFWGTPQEIIDRLSDKKWMETQFWFYEDPPLERVKEVLSEKI